MLNFLTPEITQSLMALTGVAVTGIVGWVARRLEARWGYEMDARARETLQSALTTGAMMAFARFDPTATATGPKSDAMIRTVLDHVTGVGAKDAVHRLKASPQTLKDLAEAKLTEVGKQFLGDAVSNLISRAK